MRVHTAFYAAPPKVSANCPVCDGTVAQPLLIKDGYQIVTCDFCSTQFVEPRPSFAELTTFYNRPEYYTNAEFGYTDYMAEERQIRKIARRRLSRINAIARKRGRLADLGCAAGFFLDEAVRSGWTVVGTELSAEMRAYIRQRFQFHVSPDGAEFRSDSLDVITMWEYIEHVVNPLQEIRRVAEWLRPGGMLCISTPNTSHLQARIQPADWWEYKPPAHLTFFTATTLEQLLNRAGFQVIQTRYIVPILPISGNTIFNSLQHLRKEMFSRLQHQAPFSSIYSLARRIALHTAVLCWSREQLCIGIEVYAQKAVKM